MTTLYKRTSSNSIIKWTIQQFDSRYTITWSYVGSENPITEEFACDSADRAEEEIQSRIQRQLDRKGYSTSKIPTRPDLPMLAQKWEEHRAKVESGARQPFDKVIIQPKLDGVRCIATKDKMVTRRNLEIKSVPVIKQALEALPPEIKIDGELYIHGCDLQTMQELVLRGSAHQYHKTIQYHVYDLVDTELDQQQRLHQLQIAVDTIKETYDGWVAEQQKYPPQLQSDMLPTECPIVMVPSLIVLENTNPIESLSAYTLDFYKTVDEWHKWARDNKYEGLIIRNAAGKYGINERSPDLLKVKMRLDEEFKIIDVSEGHKKTGVFVCQTEAGLSFEATPKATLGIKQNILRFKDKWIGGNTTVEYETISNAGVPLKPVAVSWRQGPKQ